MNCSATPHPSGARTRRQLLEGGARIVAAVAWMVIAAGLCTSARAGAPIAAAAAGAGAQTSSELDDAAARMQYAYYTEDAQSLQEVLRLTADLAVGPVLEPAKAYQLAYGYWKLAQLHARSLTSEPAQPGAKPQASQAAQSCARYARQAIAADGALGEAYAIQAACEGYSPDARRSTASASEDCARSRSLRKALSLAPGSPRVRLIEALCTSQQHNDPAALERWRTVVTQFEASPPSRPGMPDWGHVEALTTLGSLYLQRGDPIAARDVLERALVLVPDHREAQKLLRTASARPH